MSKKAAARVIAPRPVSPNHPSTTFLLLAQYGGRAAISLEEVCRDFFQHLAPEQLMQKVGAGDVRLVVTRIEPSQKAPKVVFLTDLADYLDRQREAAVRELEALR